jgi:hypothetical protein
VTGSPSKERNCKDFALGEVKDWTWIACSLRTSSDVSYAVAYLIVGLNELVNNSLLE